MLLSSLLQPMSIIAAAAITNNTFFIVVCLLEGIEILCFLLYVAGYMGGIERQSAGITADYRDE
jgi:hypothetical protein